MESTETLNDLIVFQGVPSLSSIAESEVNNSIELQSNDEKITMVTSATTIIISVTLGILILITIFGNIFVIYAILTDRILRRVGNYLVLSLAIADFMVACTVMPISAFYDVTGEWTFGSVLCEIWTSADVLCCTASILHLLAIALDRYWAVTRVNHIQERDAKMVGKMITGVWFVAVLISFAPILGWKDPDFMKRITDEKICLVSQDIAYQIFATCSSFYAPLVVILFLYWRIYKVAKKRIRHRPGSNITSNLRHTNVSLTKSDSNRCKESGDASHTIESTSKNYDESSRDKDKVKSTGYEKKESESAKSSLIIKLDPSSKSQQQYTATATTASSSSGPKESLEAKRERKAAKTLAIITGVFVICWLPFFILALIRPICGETCSPPKMVQSIFSWLGFTNSTLNPIIYTIFSPEFRTAFERILLGRKVNQRMSCHV